MHAIEVHHHSGYGRIGIVQSHADGTNPVCVYRNALLFHIGERVGQHDHQAVRLCSNLNRRIGFGAERYLDANIASFAQHLQSLNVYRAIRRSLRRCATSQHQQQPNLFSTSHSFSFTVE
jgi:hypothetical protein